MPVRIWIHEGETSKVSSASTTIISEMSLSTLKGAGPYAPSIRMRWIVCVKFDKDDCKVIEFKPSKRAIENCRKDRNGNPEFRAVGETYPACSP